ncbi:MAG: hypothetical protein HWN80_13310 [Candidatus Lokiarchaeota archaeon]|nr:hypothetical protein [Candidatus Lokiarchaeota archaeon]
MKIIPKLKCDICGNETEVPVCCEQSMMVKDNYMLCCCKSEECGYQPIPDCCGQKMNYIGT